MTSKPMRPPSNQPIGFWATRAGEAVVARTRGTLAHIGVSQPEWWVLQQISQSPTGVDRAAMIETIRHNDTTDAIENAVQSASGKGWIVDDGNQLKMTDLGAESFQRAAELQDDLQSERMQGIPSEDFATTIKTLQHIITNVGGDAWHW